MLLPKGHLESVVFSLSLWLPLVIGSKLSVLGSLALWPANSTLQHNALRNPYPVPDRSFSIDFRTQEENIPEVDARRCLSLAFAEVLQHIDLYGDGDIPEHTEWTHGTADFGISRLRHPPPPVLSYNDTLVIIHAFSMKAHQDGYRRWYGEIFRTEDEAFLGDALLSLTE